MKAPTAKITNQKPELLIDEVQEVIKRIKTSKKLDGATRSKIIGISKVLRNTDFSEKARAEKFDAEIEAVNELINLVTIETDKLNFEQINEDVQNEVAQLVTLLQKVQILLYKNCGRNWWCKLTGKSCRNPSKGKELSVLVSNLEVALLSLFQEEPNISFARQVRREAKRSVIRYENGIPGIFINRFDDVKRAKSVPLKVLFGLITSLAISAGATCVTVIPFYVGLYIQPGKDNQIVDAIDKLEKQLALEVGQVSSQVSREAVADLPSLSTDRAASNLTSETQDANNADNQVVQAIENQLKIQKDNEISKERVQEINSKLQYLKKLRSEELGILYVVNQIGLVIFAGTLGSIISILTRIEDFENNASYKEKDPVIPILIGAFKPIIGASFAVFVFALLNSGIIWVGPNQNGNSSSIPTGTNQPIGGSPIEGKRSLVFAIAFVVGFSERLAKDAIDKVENTFSSSNRGRQNHSEQAAVDEQGMRVSRLESERSITLERTDLSTQSDQGNGDRLESEA